MLGSNVTRGFQRAPNSADRCSAAAKCTGNKRCVIFLLSHGSFLHLVKGPAMEKSILLHACRKSTSVPYPLCWTRGGYFWKEDARTMVLRVNKGSLELSPRALKMHSKPG